MTTTIEFEPDQALASRLDLTPQIESEPPQGTAMSAPSPSLNGSACAASPYITGTHIQYAFDSTSLSLFKECPRKYYYSQLRGLRRKRGPGAPALWGQAFHKALETYELHKGESTRDQAIAAAMEAGRNAALGMEEHRTRTAETLFRSIGAYIEHHAREPLVTALTGEGTPAVELSFQLPMDATVWEQQEIIYCGHFDRVVDFQGTQYILDSKTTSASISTEKGAAQFFAQYTPDNQISGYTWGANLGFGLPVRGVIIDAMQVAKTKTEFAREIVHRTHGQIVEWRNSSIAWMRLAATSAAHLADANVPLDHGSQFYPLNERSCHKYGGCQFRGICGRDPQVREAFLQTEFEVKEWNPLAPRQQGTLETATETDATDE